MVKGKLYFNTNFLSISSQTLVIMIKPKSSSRKALLRIHKYFFTIFDFH